MSWSTHRTPYNRPEPVKVVRFFNNAQPLLAGGHNVDALLTLLGTLPAQVLVFNHPFTLLIAALVQPQQPLSVPGPLSPESDSKDKETSRPVISF